MGKLAHPTPATRCSSQEEAWESPLFSCPAPLGGRGRSKALGKEAKADFKCKPAGPSPRKASEHGREEVAGVGVLWEDAACCPHGREERWGRGGAVGRCCLPSPGWEPQSLCSHVNCLARGRWLPDEPTNFLTIAPCRWGNEQNDHVCGPATETSHTHKDVMNKTRPTFQTHAGTGAPDAPRHMDLWKGTLFGPWPQEVGSGVLETVQAASAKRPGRICPARLGPSHNQTPSFSTAACEQ